MFVKITKIKVETYIHIYTRKGRGNYMANVYIHFIGKDRTSKKEVLHLHIYI